MNTCSDTSEVPLRAHVEERRCHVCQCKHASFGFKPPLATHGRTIWACIEHRVTVERIAKGDPALREQAGPAGLL